MRFEWIDGNEFKTEEVRAFEEQYGISRYEGRLYDDDGNKIDGIVIFDYSTKWEVKNDIKNKVFRDYAYIVSYYNGYSMGKGFDKCANNRNHFGWQGTKEHTIDDIKNWCEEYIASRYIINYEEELAKLQKRKEVSDWFVENGYGKRGDKDDFER